MSGHVARRISSLLYTLDCTTRSNLWRWEQRQMSGARCMDSVGTLWHRVSYRVQWLARALCWPPQAGGARVICVGWGPGARDRCPHCIGWLHLATNLITGCTACVLISYVPILA